MRNRMRRGVAIEYVMLTMALVAGLVSALLVAAAATSREARRVRNHTEQKAVLDESARVWLDWLENGGRTAAELETEFNGNEFSYVFRVSSSDLIATYNREVVLYVEAERVDGEIVTTAYRYGYIG